MDVEEQYTIKRVILRLFTNIIRKLKSRKSLCTGQSVGVG
jgi:hypothetical protein